MKGTYKNNITKQTIITTHNIGKDSLQRNHYRNKHNRGGGKMTFCKRHEKRYPIKPGAMNQKLSVLPEVLDGSSLCLENKNLSILL